MKRYFLLLVVALTAMALFSGCQKYDDTQIRQEIKDLGERVAALEAWTRNSQEAVDYVAVLKEAVKNMNSIESVSDFEDEHGSGYVITFTNKQTIRLYHGKDGDAFFGNVNVGSSSVEFILADGTSFIVDRVSNSIGFDSFETKTVARGDTIWTVMNEAFTKSEYAAFTAELKTDDGTATSIATKSAADGNPWKIEAVAPEFGEDGKLVRPAGVVFKMTPQTGSKGVLKVSLVTNNGKETSSSLVVDIVPNYLAFEAVEAGATVSMEIVGECEAPSLKYSTDLKEWITFDFSNPQTITLENVGDKVYWHNDGKADHFSKDVDNYVHFVLGDKKIAASGNVMSLVDNSCESKKIPSEGCFSMLFYQSASLTTAPELPAINLTKNCYRSLFNGCSSLVKAPELPATTLSTACYFNMFRGCESLEVAPVLSANELTEHCYYCMFDSCTSLTEAPDILADKVGRSSCFSMFDGCTSLKKAPALPAMQLGECCYQQMFRGCTSLEKAPELPATELATACYSMMFSECKSLKEAPALPALKLEAQCYFAMFQGCESLEKAPELPAMEMTSACYFSMFLFCSSLKNAPALPATKLEPYCYYEMFLACESLVNAPELPATELVEGCYLSMFEECTSLETAPELPAKNLADYCYNSMFWDCFNLKNTPELRATELAPYCYRYMFGNCTSLTETTALPATELADYCYAVMFGGCTSLEKAPELPAENLVLACYESLFEECEKIDHVKVGFTDWGDGYMTRYWLNGTASEGSFEGPEILEAKYGENYIPEGWTFNGKAPEVAVKSYAAPATKSINHSIRKTLVPKNPEIQGRLVEHEMITL